MRIFLVLLLFAAIKANAHDLTALPLGDGKLSNSPKVGWIWPCHTDKEAGGAGRNGPWINATKGTYDLTLKAIVPGSVTWPANFSIQLQKDKRVFISNDLSSHPTGIYPVPSTSEAFRYDKNPNQIAAQDVFLELPANPTLANQASCAPGAVGILLSGSALFNALDAPGRDAVAHETQDNCQGHPQNAGVYHYHSVSQCVDTKREADEHSTLVGYMVDGFGIYGHYGEGGKLLTSQDLDECHGHTHKIMWDGQIVNMYHYHATWDFPYTAGCMRGRYNMSDVMKLSGPPPSRKNGFQEPSPEASRARSPDIRQPRNEMGRDPRDAGHPDLNKAASMLGINPQKLRDALGLPPPDLENAARRLGVSVDKLKSALDAARE